MPFSKHCSLGAFFFDQQNFLCRKIEIWLTNKDQFRKSKGKQLENLIEVFNCGKKLATFVNSVSARKLKCPSSARLGTLSARENSARTHHYCLCNSNSPKIFHPFNDKHCRVQLLARNNRKQKKGLWCFLLLYQNET